MTVLSIVGNISADAEYNVETTNNGKDAQEELGVLAYGVELPKDLMASNIRAYLLTALYNAPITIGPYYSAAVRHDFG